MVLRNAQGVVANEDFIEIRPYSGDDFTPTLLAFLNSTLGEYLVRAHSFQYGGGVFNLNPGDVPKVPVPDPAEIDRHDLGELTFAWERFVRMHPSSDARALLDAHVASILGIHQTLLDEIGLELESMRDRTNVARLSHGDSHDLH
jgi:hypothetical protein